MSEEPKRKQYPPTLCWACAKATGYCSWSQDLKPVKGWKAVGTKRELYGGVYRSAIVLECPEFVADSLNYGLVRLNDKRLEED